MLRNALGIAPLFRPLLAGCISAGDFDGFSHSIIAEAFQAVHEEKR